MSEKEIKNLSAATDTWLTELTETTVAAGDDVFHVVDVDDLSSPQGTSKKIKKSNLGFVQNNEIPPVTDLSIAIMQGTTGNVIKSGLPQIQADGRITNGTDPINSQDLATKFYVDNAVSPSLVTWDKVVQWQLFQDQQALYGGAESTPYAWDIGFTTSDDISNPLVHLTLSNESGSSVAPIYSNLLTFNSGSDGLWRFSGLFYFFTGNGNPNQFFIQLWKKGAPNTLIRSWNIGPNNNPQGRFTISVEHWMIINTNDQYFFNAGQMAGNLASDMSFKTQANSPANGIEATPGVDLELWREVAASETRTEINSQFPLSTSSTSTIVEINTGVTTFQLSYDFANQQFIIINQPGGVTLNASFSIVYAADSENGVLVTPSGVVGPPADVLAIPSPSSSFYLTEDGTLSTVAAANTTNAVVRLYLNTSVTGTPSAGRHIELTLSRSDLGYIFDGFYRQVNL